MRHLTYLALLGGCLLLTVPLDRIFRAGVFGRPGRLLLALLPGALLFGGWDVYAIGRHSWTYDQAWTSGVLLPGGLPLEEALFFVVVPLAAIITYQCVLTTRIRRDELATRPGSAAAAPAEEQAPR